MTSCPRRVVHAYSGRRQHRRPDTITHTSKHRVVTVVMKLSVFVAAPSWKLQGGRRTLLQRGTEFLNPCSSKLPGARIAT